MYSNCDFDNDPAANAVRNAMHLKTILEARGEWRPPPDDTPGPGGPVEIPGSDPQMPADVPTELPDAPNEVPAEPPGES